MIFCVRERADARAHSSLLWNREQQLMMTGARICFVHELSVSHSKMVNKWSVCTIKTAGDNNYNIHITQWANYTYIHMRASNEYHENKYSLSFCCLCGLKHVVQSHRSNKIIQIIPLRCSATKSINRHYSFFSRKKLATICDVRHAGNVLKWCCDQRELILFFVLFKTTAVTKHGAQNASRSKRNLPQ